MKNILLTGLILSLATLIVQAIYLRRVYVRQNNTMTETANLKDDLESVKQVQQFHALQINALKEMLPLVAETHEIIKKVALKQGITID